MAKSAVAQYDSLDFSALVEHAIGQGGSVIWENPHYTGAR